MGALIIRTTGINYVCIIAMHLTATKLNPNLNGLRLPYPRPFLYVRVNFTTVIDPDVTCRRTCI